MRYRLGTGFAFLTQICLAHAATVAYIQWVWRRCRQQTTQIALIDAAFAVDRNIFMLLNLRFISNFPVAAALIMVFWYVIFGFACIAAALMYCTAKGMFQVPAIVIPDYTSHLER